MVMQFDCEMNVLNWNCGKFKCVTDWPTPTPSMLWCRLIFEDVGGILFAGNPRENKDRTKVFRIWREKGTKSMCTLYIYKETFYIPQSEIDVKMRGQKARIERLGWWPPDKKEDIASLRNRSVEDISRVESRNIKKPAKDWPVKD